MLVIAYLFLSGTLFGQTDIDALRYSRSVFGTTARSLSMGGAFGALGADFSVLSQNPAGIAVFRRSEFTISPMFNYTSSQSEYLKISNDDGRLNFGFTNFGAQFHRNIKNGHGWKNWNFGIGYNRNNNFSGRISYEGLNSDNSLLDYYLEELQSNGIDPANIYDEASFETGQAFSIYLIDSINGNQYYTALPNAGELQRRSKRSRGSHGEWDLSFGGNYNDRLYLGVTLGIGSVRYIEDSKYEEIDVNNLHDTIGGLDFSSFTLNQYLNTSGTGINLKAGVIYRPADWVRVGLAFHTPTFYNLSDDYSAFLISRFSDGTEYISQTLQGAYDYDLTTPFKAIGSVAFIIGNYGLISGDYEYIDYSTSKLDSRDYNFNEENNSIESKYTSASNIRVGGEYRYDIFSFRLGGAYYGTPFQSGLNSRSEDQHQLFYTGGLGIKGKNMFVDFGYSFGQWSEFYQPYSLNTEEVPSVRIKTNDHRLMVTFGVKW